MPHGVIVRGDPTSSILRVPKIYGRLTRNPRVVTLRGDSIEEADVLRRKIFVNTWRWSSLRVELAVVRCEEHDCTELLPLTHYWSDLRAWYEVGRHPRFSVFDALCRFGRQGIRDARTILWRFVRPGRGRRDVRRELQGNVMRDALRKCRNPRDLVRRLQPFLRTRIRIGRLQFNVTNEFAERFHERSFTVRDFLDQPNQELRRIIARFVPIPRVVAAMNEVARDDEGTIYEEKGTLRHYLHVICPSTKQDYLLEIPRQIREGDPQRFRDLVSPAEARRWTFDLPVDAEFAKEA